MRSLRRLYRVDLLSPFIIYPVAEKRPIIRQSIAFFSVFGTKKKSPSGLEDLITFNLTFSYAAAKNCDLI